MCVCVCVCVCVKYACVCIYICMHLYIYIISMCLYTHMHVYINTHTMEPYSDIIKNEILPFAILWMDLQGIMLSEISQTENDKYCMLSHKEFKKKIIYMTKQKQTYQIQRRSQ